MDDIGVSLIIPTIRGEDAVKKCLSLLEHSINENLNEVIIVNNGIKKLQEDCFSCYPCLVKVINTPPLIGASRARNIGAAESRSQVVCFLDDDDYFENNYIDRNFELIKSNGKKAIYVTRLKINDLRNDTKYNVIFPSDLYNQKKLFVTNNGFSGQNLFIHREIFNHLQGFDQRIVCGEDRDLGLRAIFNDIPIIPLAGPSVVVNRDYGGLSDKFLKGNVQFFRKHYTKMPVKYKLQNSFKILKAACGLLFRKKG